MNWKNKTIWKGIGLFLIIYIVIWGSYYIFTNGLESRIWLLQTRRYIPSALAVTLAIAVGHKIGLSRKQLLLHLVVGVVWLLSYPATYWLAFHQNTAFINYYFDAAFASYVVAASIGVHGLLYYWGNKFIKWILPLIIGLWQGLLLLLPIVEWVYWGIFSTPITESTWLALLQTNFKESKEFIGQSTVIGGVVAGVIGILVLIAIFIYLNYRWQYYTKGVVGSSKEEHSSTRVFVSKKVLAVSCILTIATGAYAARSFVHTGVMEAYVFAKQYYVAAEAFTKNHAMNMESMTVTPSTPKFSKPSTIIMVIGESGTRTFLSAYNKTKNDTSPWLRKKVLTDSQNFLLFRHAYTSWTQTVPSLERALTEKNQYNSKEFNQSTTVLDLAKKAGYTTYWFSNQGTISDADTPITLVAKTADHSVWLEDLRQGSSKIAYDEDLLPLLKQVDPTKNNFVVIHIMGSHEDYTNRFPDSFTKFGHKYSNGLEDNYDNTLAYTDYVLQKIYEYGKDQLNLQAMVYFSDHGNAPRVARNPDKAQFISTRIPMFIYVSNEYRSLYPQTVATLSAHEDSYFTNDLIYELIGGLLNIQSNRLNMSNSLASPTYKYTRDTLMTNLGRNKLTEDIHEDEL